MRKDKISRISRELDDKLKKTANAKIVNGTAKLNKRGSYSHRRLTLALARHADIDKILRDIEKAEWEGDKPSRR